jgi:hypothetical protein
MVSRLTVALNINFDETCVVSKKMRMFIESCGKAWSNIFMKM